MNSISKWLTTLVLLSGTVYGMEPQEAVSDSKAPSSHAVQTNLPGVYAFKQPPANFDVRTASQEELAAWGYPPRPGKESAAYAAGWRKSILQ